MTHALFGDWLSGQLSPAAQGGRARAFPWLPSVTHLDGPHASILLMGHARPVLAQGPETHRPAMSHVSLAFTSRSRTAGSKGALRSRSRTASFLKMGQVCVTGPVQTREWGGTSIKPLFKEIEAAAADRPMLEGRAGCFERGEQGGRPG